jgi:hypothetical protein
MLPIYFELTIFLQGGHEITVKCKEYSFSYHNETGKYTKYSVKGIQSGQSFGFNLNEMIGYQCRRRIGWMF